MAKSNKKNSKITTKLDPGRFRLKRAKFFCEKVEDGDTLKGTISFRRWGMRRSMPATVQLIGLRAPELHVMEAGKNPDDYAVEAMNFTKRRVEGKTVRMKFAVDRTGQWIREGQYQGNRWNEPRVLAIVYPRFRWESVNVKLVKKGYARVNNKPDWMTKEFGKALERAQRDARRHQRGVWTNQEWEEGGISPWEVLIYCLLSFGLGYLVHAMIVQ